MSADMAMAKYVDALTAGSDRQYSYCFGINLVQSIDRTKLERTLLDAGFGNVVELVSKLPQFQAKKTWKELRWMERPVDDLFEELIRPYLPYLHRRAEAEKLYSCLCSNLHSIAELSKKPLMFQCINISGMGKTQFGLHLLEELKSVASQQPNSVLHGASRTSGRSVHVDWGSHIYHDGWQSDIEIFAMPSADDFVTSFVILRLLAKIHDLWTHDFCSALSLTFNEYHAFASSEPSAILSLLAQLAGRLEGDPEAEPTFLVMHLDEPQILKDHWRQAHIDHDSVMLVKAIFCKIACHAPALWNEYRIVLVVLVTGNMCYPVTPTVLQTEYVPMSLLPAAVAVKGLRDEFPGMALFQPDNEDQLMRLEVILRQYGLFPYMFFHLWVSLKYLRESSDKDVVGYLRQDIVLAFGSKMTFDINEWVKNPIPRLLYCYYALMGDLCPAKIIEPLRVMRESGVLLGSDVDSEWFEPLAVTPLLRCYVPGLDAVIPASELPEGMTEDNAVLLGTAMRNFLSSSTALTTDKDQSWSGPLVNIIFVRLLYHIHIKRSPCSWAQLLPSLSVWKGTPDCHSLLERHAPSQVTKIASQLGRHHLDDPLHTLRLTSTCPTYIGLNSDQVCCLALAVDSCAEDPLDNMHFYSFCASVAQQNESVSVVGIIVFSERHQGPPLLPESHEAGHPDNLSLFFMSEGARKLRILRCESRP